MAVEKTVEKSVVIIGGKEYPMTVTRYIGLARYVGIANEEIWADDVTYVDFGPKQGGGWSYTIYKEYTPEERAAARRRIIDVATKSMIDQGIW